MKVNDPNVTGVTGGQVDGAGLDRARQIEADRRGPASQDPSLTDSPDRVALSGLGALLRAASSNSSERVGRLQKLSADVAAGRYHVDAQAISQRLIDDMFRNGSS